MTFRQLHPKSCPQRLRQKSSRRDGGIHSSPRQGLLSNERTCQVGRPRDRSPTTHHPSRIHCSGSSDSWVFLVRNRQSPRRRRRKSPIPTSHERRCRRIWTRWTSVFWRRCVNPGRARAFATLLQHRLPTSSSIQPSLGERPSWLPPKPSMLRGRQGLANRSLQDRHLPILLQDHHSHR